MPKFMDRETQILLLNRKTGVETRYRTDTFFFMHIINSFENKGKVIIDVCAYKDAKIINTMYVEAIKNVDTIPDYGKWSQCRPKRIEIPVDAPPFAKVEARLLADVGIETPRINYEANNGRPYKYFYGIGTEVNSKYAGSIIKIDTQTGEVQTWYELDATPSEPVFVAHPDAKEEDDGVLLSAIIWSKKDNVVTLIMLKARDLQEIARADFTTPSHVPNGFHGWYFPDSISIKRTN